MSTKSKGSTPSSLYGKTEAPIEGEVLDIRSMERPFDHEDTVCTAYKVLVDHGDGETRQHWFNTYKNGDGPEYIGDAVSTTVNSSPCDKAKFESKCAEKGYTTHEGTWPPQVIDMDADDDSGQDEGDIEVEEEDADLIKA